MSNRSIEELLVALHNAEFDLAFADQYFPSLAHSFRQKVDLFRSLYLAAVSRKRDSEASRCPESIPQQRRFSSKPHEGPPPLHDVVYAHLTVPDVRLDELKPTPLPKVPRSWSAVCIEARRIKQERQNRHTTPATPFAKDR